MPRPMLFSALLLGLPLAQAVCGSRAAAQLALPAWMQVRHVSIESGAISPEPTETLSPALERDFRRASWATAAGAGMLVGGLAGAAGATLTACARRGQIGYSVPVSAAVALGGLALTTYGTRRIRSLRAQHSRPPGFVGSTVGRWFLMTVLTTGVLAAASIPEVIMCSD